MSESHSTPPAETAVKSPLDKPLHRLTEEDIAQLTREDCRRYLKEKGMRRPSWNKSQAIEQVIMLKSLLETTPDSDAGSSKRFRISRPRNNDGGSNVAAESVPKETSDDAGNSVSAEETTPYLSKDLDKPDSSGGLSGRFAAATPDETAKLRTTVSANMPVGQMTIFYCGKVNVYDDMPADKARTIINIAESSLHFPEEQVVDGATLPQPLPPLSKDGSIKGRSDSAPVILPTLHTVKKSNNPVLLGEENDMIREETPVEGPSTRKASVQRYLEKRKDRFKSKRKAGMTSCASLDIYFNHQMGNQMPIIDKYSPPQIGPSSTPSHCSSVDNDSVKNICLSTGLSNKDL